MTSKYFLQSKYSSATTEEKIKLVEKITDSIRILIGEVQQDSTNALDQQIDLFLGIAAGLEMTVPNDQRMCRGCFVVSDTIGSCQSCQEVQACDYCTDDEWNLLNKCEKCGDIVCWKCKARGGCVNKKE